MFKFVLLLFVVAITVLLAFAATRPDSFRVERSTNIKTSPEKVFALINDFHQWGAWSPWEKMDADLKRDYSGAANGVGSVYGWEGKKTGVGRMEILESTPSAQIKIKLDFFKPFEAHNSAEFTLQAKGDTTDVNWAMYGPTNFMTKLMGVFMSMDRMVGKDFETGLANMKAAAEK